VVAGPRARACGAAARHLTLAARTRRGGGRAPSAHAAGAPGAGCPDRHRRLAGAERQVRGCVDGRWLSRRKAATNRLNHVHNLEIRSTSHGVTRVVRSEKVTVTPPKAQSTLGQFCGGQTKETRKKTQDRKSLQLATVATDRGQGRKRASQGMAAAARGAPVARGPAGPAC